MRRIFFLIIGTMACAFGTKAQVSLTTDRPGQAMSARILKYQNLQYATGIDLQNSKNTLTDNSKFASTVWDNVFRYGIDQHGELGIGFQAMSNQTQIDDSIFLSRGISRLSLKFRNNIIFKSSRFRALAYEIDLGVPLRNEVSDNRYFSPKLTLSSEIKLSEKFNAVLNLGILYDGVFIEPLHFHVVNVNYSINNRWSLFAEYYASYQNNIYDGKWDAGFAFLQNGNCQIDLSGGYDTNSTEQNQWFVGIGVSWLKPNSRDLLD